MAAGRLALSCLIVLGVLATQVTSQCEIPTSWPSGFGANPFDLYRGKVLLAALVKSHCNYCIRTSTRLEQMKQAWAGRGFTELEVILVNKGTSLARRYISNLHQASNLTVYQDSANFTLYDNVFHANCYDFVFYDKCGQRVGRLSPPYTNLDYNFTAYALDRVYHNLHSCDCEPGQNTQNIQSDQPAQNSQNSQNSRSQDIYSRMQGDQPIEARNGYPAQDSGDVDLNCNYRNFVCNHYQRLINRGVISRDAAPASRDARPYHRRVDFRHGNPWHHGAARRHGNRSRQVGRPVRHGYRRQGGRRSRHGNRRQGGRRSRHGNGRHQSTRHRRYGNRRHDLGVQIKSSPRNV